MPGDPSPEDDNAYELLDAGDGRRLERFGARVVDRPAPGARERRLADFLTWRRADLRFDGTTGWFGDGAAMEPWVVSMAGIRMELRPTASGGLGLYPEHAANLGWVSDRLAERHASTERGRQPGAERGTELGVAPHPDGAAAATPQVLNLFAHTGLVTLGAALAGAAVAHLDASKGTVDWARRNAALSGLDDRPIRWLVDDALGFVAREARRDRRYDGIVLDPPSFGRAGRRQWRLLDELPSLLEACASVATADVFLLLTAHTAGLEGNELANAVAAAFPGARPEIVPMGLDAASGARLDLGWAVRMG